VFVRIAESNVGPGAAAVIPLPTVGDDRLDVLAYDGNFVSVAAVEDAPPTRRSRTALGPCYAQFVSVAPRIEQARIIAYRPAAGVAQLISLRGVPLNDMQVTSGCPFPLPNLTGASTHLISGIKPDGELSWPFVLAYNAHSRHTCAYLLGWTPGVRRWITATTTRLPGGISSMTALRVGQQAYVALVRERRLRSTSSR